MRSIFSLLLVGLAVAAPTVTVNRDVTPVEARDNTIEPRQATSVIFNSVTASGTGCPSGSYSVTISPSKDVATIGFRQYSAVLPSPATRDCKITISLTYPGGCTSGSLQGTTHGWAQVNSGVTGTYTTSYTSTTGNNANPPASTFSGSSWAGGNSFTKTDTAPAKVINRSPNNAGVTVTVNTSAKLSSGSGGDLTPDDMTFRIINQSRNPNWQTCT